MGYVASGYWDDGYTETDSIALVIQDGLHGHTADNLTLGTTTNTALVVADALHGHTADEVAEETPAEPNGLTQAGVIPKIWPGLSVRYEGKRQKVKNLEDEDRQRIEKAAVDAVTQAAEESSKKAMRASIQASMRAAEIELSAAALSNLLTQAAAYQQELIEEEEITIAMIFM